MNSRLHVHVPLREIERYLPLLLERRLQPEIALQAFDLDQHPPNYFSDLGARFQAAGLAVSVHAPFMDLNPGAVEPLVQQVTTRRYQQTLDAAARLGAHLVVFHPGFDRWRYGNQEAAWTEQSLSFWPQVCRQAENSGLKLALENIYDADTRLLVSLIEQLNCNCLGHCFDIGHWQIFGHQSLPTWLDSLKDRLFHLHLHDNKGRNDDHLPIGAGKIDFEPLWNHLRKTGLRPTMTLEAHKLKHLERSLVRIAPLLAELG